MNQTVYIIDDDEAVCDSIKELLESVELEAETFSSAQSFLQSYKPGVATGCIVLDVRMAEMSGLSLQEKLNKMNIRIPIIFITGHGDIDMAVGALKAGAVDFIQKPYHEQNLLESINTALELDVRNSTMDQQADHMDDKLKELTNREREVMNFLIQGQTNKNIAQRLDISPRTVEAHRQHILEKFKVKSVIHLMYLLNYPPA